MIGGLGVSLEKSLEVDTGSELTEEYLQVTSTNYTCGAHTHLQGEIHPVKSLNKPKFAKPKGPSRAGGKRITKIPVNNGGPKAAEENEGPKEEGGVDSTS